MLAQKSVVQRSLTYEERDENSGIHHDETKDSCPSVAETVGDWPCKEHTDQSTALARLKESALPFCLNGFDTIMVYSISIFESRERNEVTVQEHVKGFHDLVAT